jgi:hypothetical protein
MPAPDYNELSRVFNLNAATLIQGLEFLKNEPGSRFEFNVVASKRLLSGERLLVTTNIPLDEASPQKLAVILDPYKGFRAYGYSFAGKNGLQLDTTSFKQDSGNNGEQDAATVGEVLIALTQRAKTQGLLARL